LLFRPEGLGRREFLQMLREDAPSEGILQWKLMPAKKKLAMREIICPI
jgi:hypothetical protein